MTGKCPNHFCFSFNQVPGELLHEGGVDLQNPHDRSHKAEEKSLLSLHI